MHPWRFLLLGVLVWTLSSPAARAHYLFIHIGPAAEAGRAAEVYFSELAEAGDPRFIDKIAHTQLWLQATPGEFRSLKVHKGADRLRALVPVSGSMVVIGVCQYGVLARPKQASFLLRHYPKAMAGSPAELNRMQPYGKVPLEIMATVDGERLRLVALREGKPLLRAEFHTVDASLNGEKLSADADGIATWKPPQPGRYSVYTSTLTKEMGNVDGKSYEELREFATLAFAWPLERNGPDPKAVALFQEAVAARAQWKDFPGFRARIEGILDGRPFDGTVTIDAAGGVRVETEESVVEPWVKEQLESIAMHRGAGTPAQASAEVAQPILRFAEQREDHPLGQLLAFQGGRFASSYRVKDKQIMVVNRHVGRHNMTITILENDRNTEGFFLPRSYVVQYWDATTGDLRHTETVQDRWLRFGAWDLPAAHAVTTASDTGLSVRSFRLSQHRLLSKNASGKDAEPKK
jgi:hypothetical protein